MDKKTFCMKPFSGLFLSPDGGVKYCCALNESLGNINEESIDEIIKGKTATDIRKKIIDGEWHDLCSYCKKVEERGGRSERVDDINRFTSEQFKLEEIDLRWSNTCNLSCNYCNSLFSSKWAIINGEKINKNKEHSETTLIDFVSKNQETLNSVFLLGGEPLLQKQNEQLLKNVGDANIQLLTNLSIDLINNKIFNILKENKNVNWNVSFETIGDKFEYVRHDAKWETFLNNLRIVSKISKNGIGAQPVYCLYSAFNLDEFYDFIETEGYFNNVWWQNLTHPDVLDVFNLPKELKQIAVDEINRCIKKYKKYDFSTLLNIRDSLIQSEDKDLTKNFLLYNENLEKNQLKNKKNTFKNLYPDLYKSLIKI